MLGAGLVLAATMAACGDRDAEITHVSGAHSGTAAHVSVARTAPGVVASDEVSPRLLRRFAPLPDVHVPANAAEEARVDLGRMLFFEPRLSKSGEVSCNSCHALDQYGVDHRKTSLGIGGQLGGRNAPTVYNASGHFTQFWDGRATNVEAQALGPILNPKEMGIADGSAAITSLRAISGYAPLFAKAFPGVSEPMTFANVGDAIGAFERGLTTPGRWDSYLRGDLNALTSVEKKGLKVFLNSGCMVCHTGAYLGGSMFERVGVVEPWPNQEDKGRANVTNVAGDQMMFKVPSLRNVARTGPYFHDGSAETLDDAVKAMGRFQLGLDFSDEEAQSIVSWLHSLTGELPRAYIQKPALPGGK
jgi:cytochrome c peroxidase